MADGSGKAAEKDVGKPNVGKEHDEAFELEGSSGRCAPTKSTGLVDRPKCQEFSRLGTN